MFVSNVLFLFAFATIGCQPSTPTPSRFQSSDDGIYREKLQTSYSSDAEFEKDDKDDRVDSRGYEDDEEDEEDDFVSSRSGLDEKDLDKIKDDDQGLDDESDMNEEISTEEEVADYVVGNAPVMTALTSCGNKTPEADFDIYLSGKNDFTFGSWNNTGVDPTSDDVSKYADKAFDPAQGKIAEADCGGREVVSSTFVKKLHNWHSQHFNGLVMTAGSMPIDKMSGVVVELMVHSDGTALPTEAQIQSSFESHFAGNDFEAANLDQSQTNFLLTFEVSDSGRVLKARYPFEIKESDFDKWLQFVVPVESLTWFYEENYTPEFITYEEALQSDMSFTRAVFVAESSSLGTARSMLGIGDDAAFNGLNVPPLFKEQAITIHRISVVE
ncbi:MAG: hypothetical protein AB8C84_06415 [Oligoflexales bacterium]